MPTAEQNDIMKRTKRYLLLAVVALLFSSCKVEFSPNGPWNEIPVVYCVLDQEDDTTFVRVQRCYLAEDNQYAYASVADSIYYPQDALTVQIEEWSTWKDSEGARHRYGDNPVRVFNFDYTEQYVKDDGDFCSDRLPLYCCATGGQLDTNKLYRLVITKNATGDTLATAETMLIYGPQQLVTPNNILGFNFSGTNNNKKCEISWISMNLARQYQPIVRFYYRDFIVNTLPSGLADTTIIPHYIDIPCPVKKSSTSPGVTLSVQLEQTTFLTTIRENINDPTINKNIRDTVDIFVNCATEDLAAYIFASSPSNGINQERYTYTNINGGLGIFAARRTHIVYTVQSPASATSDYKKKLKELGVGF